MKLYESTIKMERQHDHVVILPAFDEQTAKNKIISAIKQGKLAYYHNNGKTTIQGIINNINTQQIHHQAFHNRAWNEKTEKFSYTKPVPNHLLGRQIAKTTVNLNTLAALSQGKKDAKKDFSRKAKNCETKLKKALKSFNGNSTIYENAYRKQWEQIAKNTTTTTTKKKTKKVKVA